MIEGIFTKKTSGWLGVWNKTAVIIPVPRETMLMVESLLSEGVGILNVYCL